MGFLWKDQRWDTQRVKLGGGKSVPLILFKILFSWKKTQITIFWSSSLSRKINNIIYYGQCENISQPLKLFKWNYSTWFGTNAQMVLRSNNSYWGDFKCRVRKSLLVPCFLLNRVIEACCPHYNCNSPWGSEPVISALLPVEICRKKKKIQIYFIWLGW